MHPDELLHELACENARLATELSETRAELVTLERALTEQRHRELALLFRRPLSSLLPLQPSHLS